MIAAAARESQGTSAHVDSQLAKSVPVPAAVDTTSLLPQMQQMEVCSPKESEEMSVKTDPTLIKDEPPASPVQPVEQMVLEPVPVAPPPVAAAPAPQQRAPRHRRSASAPSHLLSASVLGKRKPLKSPSAPASRTANSKSRAAKLTRARAMGALPSSETVSRASFDEDSTSSMSFALKQGKQGSRDEGKTNRHPTWIRSNMRATWGHLSIKTEDTEEAEAMQSLLRDATPYAQYASASLVFEMLYDNGDEVELLEKKGGNLADRVKLILPNGNVEQGITMPDTTIAYHTSHGGSKSVKSHYFQFDSARFPWNSDKKSKLCQEEDTIEIGLKFATNVTTRAHNKRRFMWRVDLRLYGHDGSELAHRQTTSPAFSYLPRNPEKSAQDFRLDDVVCDGHAGDLLMCGGSGLGTKERPNLVALLQGPRGAQYTLARHSATKATFVSRLPSDIRAGNYTVQLCNEDNPDEATEELKMKVLESSAGPCFELDEFTKQLEAEALSRGTGSSGSEDEAPDSSNATKSPHLSSQTVVDEWSEQ